MKTIYEIYVPVTSQQQADRLKAICVEYGLPIWHNECAFDFERGFREMYLNSREMENKLIPMVDFVLAIDNVEPKAVNFASITDIRNYQLQSYSKIVNYATFLKQPLKPGMFVPCHENDVPLVEPENYELWCKYGDFTQYGKSLTAICKPYKEAKERVLFEGFEYQVAPFCDEPMLEIFDKSDNYLVYDCEDKNFQDADELFFETIEDIVKYNLILTPNALKQFEL
jgi:hypothetical protein